jgi:dTDP-4-dehydrorhamnose reductase
LKILLTGKNGQVGYELAGALRTTQHQVIAVGSADCDLAKPAAVRELIQSTKPDVVINPAAYTAVDRAESEPELAHSINAQAPEVMAAELKKTGGLLIHFSTDYVFDGTKTEPYNELDTPNPQSIYGQTKLQGEQAIAASGVNHITLRTSWVFGAHGNNFLKTMLKLAAEREELRVVNDQFGTPTSARFLATTVMKILEAMGSQTELQRQADQAELHRRNIFGLYHCSCAGHTSWFDYAKFAIDLARSQGAKLKLAPNRLIAIPASQYPTPAARPANSVLDNTKLEQALSIQRPYWQAEVRDCVSSLQRPD